MVCNKTSSRRHHRKRSLRHAPDRDRRRRHNRDFIRTVLCPWNERRRWGAVHFCTERFLANCREECCHAPH